MRDKKSFSFSFLFIIAISFFSCFLYSCNKNDTLLGTITEKSLHGKWEETFEWKNIYAKETKTSTVIFRNHKFTLTILPPHRKFQYDGDSVYIGNNKDTLYSGSYKLSGDTLIFSINGESILHYFRYKISGDSLKVIQMPTSTDSTGFAFNLSEFLWGNSFNKHSGIFLRTSK